MPETPQTKTCGKCKIEKSIDEFGILRSSEDGHNPVYFDCKRRRDRNYKEKKFNKVKVSDHKPRSNKLKNVELPKEKIIAQHEEPAEAQLIRAFKKTTIKNFIKDLIPILEKAVEERFK